jgi:serine/threonine protein kinase
MEGLYKKVITGVYPKLPITYSKELNLVIKAMLQVNPKKRPSAEKLLNSNIVLNKVEELFSETLAETKSVLLSTIR